MGKKSKQLATINGSEAQKFSEYEDGLLWKMAEGMTPGTMAKTLAPNDKKRQAAIRRKIYRMFADIRLQDELGARVRLIQIMGLGAAVKALNRKAAAGRVDAIKLLFESSSFYNPRIQHDHGGEVTITIKNAPRPERVEEVYARDSGIVDADVVE